MDASQNRREFKFVLKPGLEERLRAEVCANLGADAHADDGYAVISEYFDSADRHSYWQKQFGVGNRRRVRTRVYGQSAGDIPASAFVEVKHKLDGMTVKRRVSCPIHDLPAISGGNIPDHLGTAGGLDGRTVNELEELLVKQGNRPVVQIRYHRYAYDSGPDGTIRITFDLDLRCRFLLKPMLPNCPEFDLALLDSGAAVMEVKTIGPVPYWFRTLVGKYNLVPRGFSKYATALEKYELNPFPR